MESRKREEHYTSLLKKILDIHKLSFSEFFSIID